MAAVSKPLIWLALLAFVLAVVVSFTGPFFLKFQAESFSRACNNLALLAIALMMSEKMGSPSGE